jgi:hypothetical protein
MLNYQDDLRKITAILLKPEDLYQDLTKTISDLHQLFLTVSGLEMEKSENREDIYLSNGKAIGPVWAAFCVKEHMRTKKFLRGVFQGIKSAQKIFPGVPIHILYAGTGPFATLAIPLTTVFSSEEINFTFLEINPVSIQYLEKVIEVFQAEKYVNQIVKCDAAAYRVAPNQPIHLIITETMQNALQKEPQVGITMNLVPQMERKGILIPQNIKIEAVLLSPKKDQDRQLGLIGETDCYYLLDTVFELNKQTPELYPIRDLTKNGSYSFPKVEVGIPREKVAEYRQLCLFTSIRVFEDTELAYWNCSLNLPQKIMDLSQVEKPVDKVSFQYMVNEKPGFTCKVEV